MRIFLDLNKAIGNIPNVSKDTPTEEQSIREHNNSFGKRPVGVAAGEENDYDDPEVGKEWRASVEKAQPYDGGFTEEESKRAAESLNLDFTKEKFSFKAFQAGINHEREHGDVSKTAITLGKIALAHLKEDPEYYTKLSKIEKSIQILKGFSEQLNKAVLQRMPSIVEQEFLRDVLGYSQEDINKGIATISGRNRALFNRWLCDRVSTSSNDLCKSIGVTVGRLR